MGSEDAEITLAMDGIIFQGGVLRVRRPKDYVPLSHGVVVFVRWFCLLYFVSVLVWI